MEEACRFLAETCLYTNQQAGTVEGSLVHLLQWTEPLHQHAFLKVELHVIELALVYNVDPSSLQSDCSLRNVAIAQVLNCFHLQTFKETTGMTSAGEQQLMNTSVLARRVCPCAEDGVRSPDVNGQTYQRYCINLAPTLLRCSARQHVFKKMRKDKNEFSLSLVHAPHQGLKKWHNHWFIFICIKQTKLIDENDQSLVAACGHELPNYAEAFVETACHRQLLGHIARSEDCMTQRLSMIMPLSTRLLKHLFQITMSVEGEIHSLGVR
mmetsp:Transcript_14088/g.33481  ORF Transcript_14088/g.33481 Transcript_14088/m.33481 type:complete len:267 (-) Transcript_14088:267-1067(-)